MAYWKLAFFWLLAATLTDCQRMSKPWDCQRMNSPCVASNGGQCQRDGSCLCTNNLFEGHNCGLRKALKVTGQCDVVCANAGVCYNDNGHKCFCPPGYIGSLCERKRVEIPRCDGDTITVNINPHETGVFNGRIYVQGHEDTGQCNINIRTPNQGYTRVLSLNTDSNVNPCRSGMDSLEGGRVKRYRIVVQYDPDMITSTDEYHIAQCSANANGQFIGVSITGVDGASFIPPDALNGEDVAIGYVPLAIRITRQPDRSALQPGAVTVSTALFLEVSLTSTTTYTSLRMETLIASERVDNPSKERTLITDGCPEAVTNGVIIAPLERRGTTVLVPFEMFKFLNFPLVYFRAQMTMCSASNPQDCIPADCNGVQNGFGRKKRESGSARTGTVSAGLFVVSEGDNTVQLGQCEVPKPEPQETCLDNPTFVIVVALLGLLLLVAIVILMLICIRVNRKAQKKNTTVLDLPPPAMTKM